MSDNGAYYDEYFTHTHEQLMAAFGAVKGKALTEEGLAETGRERDRQDARWGEQGHPVVPAGWNWIYQDEYRLRAEEWKKTNEYRAAHGKTAWDGIILEEAYEALSEVDPERYEEELIQLAASALAAWEASRRKRGADSPYAHYRQRYILNARPTRTTVADVYAKWTETAKPEQPE